ncbi:hypothetical protein, conserved [Thermococcus kodakarensis KOD1]|uniref:Uncharacterized protein n=1 Tax=Thermococcus kodakarensis (strain ATCC BAA-918 / JCM 12380 / KOD1) TaxID=69014 RepID=Q5JEG0_THEKO|nr:hypothetical protein [Thermococcus kodakarensis]WCN28178.1 hypothetical protein POG15_00340 [Thermococcus kodakarensis]WCN30475.1 hypothetical protein POG21_00340 [Thermococcus kodakarensis]BAD84254.1 hypothetical protein, conserved [Thermococcus kodakarensis KOD1]
MGEVNVRVVVPDGMEEIFKKELSVLLEALWKAKKKPRVKVKDIFGMMPSEKSAKELRMEFYEEVFG